MDDLYQSERIGILKDKMLKAPRYASIEQARIITKVYQENEGLSISKKRALSLKAALEQMEIAVEPEELIVGNRTKGVRAGVVFPESGSSWVVKEFETLPTRPQDKFLVNDEDIKEFKEKIYPYWQGKSLEDKIKQEYGDKINAISKVVKINQKDHAQGHICPDTALWLRLGPQGLMEKAQEKLKTCCKEHQEFYQCTILVLQGACNFMIRYHDYIMEIIDDVDFKYQESLKQVANNCYNLAKRPPETFHEAIQSLWFLFVILHMESNASSFSPGRIDQYLYPYYYHDITNNIITKLASLAFPYPAVVINVDTLMPIVIYKDAATNNNAIKLINIILSFLNPFSFTITFVSTEISFAVATLGINLIKTIHTGIAIA